MQSRCVFRAINGSSQSRRNPGGFQEEKQRRSDRHPRASESCEAAPARGTEALRGGTPGRCVRSSAQMNRLCRKTCSTHESVIKGVCRQDCAATITTRVTDPSSASEFRVQDSGCSIQLWATSDGPVVRGMDIQTRGWPSSKQARTSGPDSSRSSTRLLHDVAELAVAGGLDLDEPAVRGGRPESAVTTFRSGLVLPAVVSRAICQEWRSDQSNDASADALSSPFTRCRCFRLSLVVISASGCC